MIRVGFLILALASLVCSPVPSALASSASQPALPPSTNVAEFSAATGVDEDPAQPLIDALRDVSAQLRATHYAQSSDIAHQNTEFFLSGLLAQSWELANQLGQLDTPYFTRSARIEGMPGLYNPDNVYRSALLEPDGVYRVYGQRGTHAELTFQILDQYPIIGLGKNLTVVRPDELGAKHGKWFEIYLGGERPRGKIWLPLPKNALAVVARQSFADWHEIPSTLFIERIDQPLARRHQSQFVLAGTALRQAVRLWADTYVPTLEQTTKVNELPVPKASDVSAGGLGGQQNIMARYRIGKDEALVITVRKAKAVYQGIQLGDPWFVTPNTLRHQVSLTAKQAHIDDDGFIRFVISLEDPGIPNWLDAAGNPEGYVFMRWQGMKMPLSAEDAPSAKLVPLSALHATLPPNTPLISAEDRHTQLVQRKWAPQIR
ncbi:MAG: hypothetical protein RIQ67_1805 [Pseudomonadota bacterium]|jgi:hypothetical protein